MEMRWMKSKCNELAVWYLKKYGNRTVFQEIARELFTTISEKDILYIEKQGHRTNVWYKDKKLPQKSIETLRDDARLFQTSDIWKILTTEAKYQANLALYERSKTEDDMFAGKMMLYSLKVLEKKLNELKDL